MEANAAAVFQFTQLNGYPRFETLDTLTDPGTLKVRVMDPDGSTIGYTWGTWVETGVFGFHFCAKRGVSLPFFGSDLVAQLCQIAFWIGADEVVTCVDGHARFKGLRRLLLRLGFSELPRTDGGSDFSLNLWTSNGHLEPSTEDQHVAQ